MGLGVARNYLQNTYLEVASFSDGWVLSNYHGDARLFKFRYFLFTLPRTTTDVTRKPSSFWLSASIQTAYFGLVVLGMFSAQRRYLLS